MQNELTAERLDDAIAEMEDCPITGGLCKNIENGICGSCNMGNAVNTALAAIRAEQERLNPQPLTWEELSGMVGEPVWTIGECCGLDGWDIIEEVYEDSILFGRSTEQPEKWRYNLRELSGELSGCAWLAYRTKPEAALAGKERTHE